MVFINSNKETLSFDIKGESWNDIEEIRNILIDIPCIDKNYGNLSCDFSEVQELQAWLDFFAIEYSLSEEARIDCASFLVFDRETEFFRGETFDTSILAETAVPYNYQLEAINWQIKRSRIYNSFDAGLGKSFISIATSGHWYKTNKVDSLIVITQNGGLLYHWKKEILLFLNLFKDEDIAIIDNSTKKRPFAEFRDKKILIIPEHLVADIFYSYSKNADKKKKSKWTRWKNYVDIQKEWNKTSTCLLIDEAHSAKNPKAQKTKALLNHISTFNYRLFLSATPAINGFEDWFYQLFLLDKGILNMHPGAARIFVADAMGKKIGKNFIRNIIAKYNSNRVEQIKEKLKYNVIFKHKSEIPEMKTVQIIEPVFFQMPPLQRQLYENVFEEEMMKIEYKKEKITFRNIYTKFPYALQVIDNPFLLTDKIVQPKVTQILGKWKLEFDPRIVWLDKYIDEQIRVLGNKVIIFDTHPLTLDQLAKRYQDLAPLKLVGGMTAEEKSVAQEKFNKVKDSNYLILCSFQAASTGINLQEGGNIIIMWSLPQDATLYRQALDRTYRINSTKDSIVKLCVMDGTFDVIRYNRNRNRTELNDTFLNKSLSSVKLRQLLEGIM